VGVLQAALSLHAATNLPATHSESVQHEEEVSRITSDRAENYTERVQLRQRALGLFRHLDAHSADYTVDCADAEAHEKIKNLLSDYQGSIPTTIFSSTASDGIVPFDSTDISNNLFVLAIRSLSWVPVVNDVSQLGKELVEARVVQSKEIVGRKSGPAGLEELGLPWPRTVHKPTTISLSAPNQCLPPNKAWLASASLR